MTQRARADLALVGNAFIWGATFAVVKRALDDVSAYLFLGLRFAVAAAALAVLFRGRWAGPARAWYAGLLTGLFLFAGFVFQTQGLHLTTAAKSAFITGLSIPMVPFVASAVYRVRPRWMEILGALCATAGLGLITLDGSAATLSRGDLLTLCCAVAFAGHIVALGYYSTRYSIQILSFAQVALAGVLAFAMTGWAETPRISWTPAVLGAVLVTGLLATALTFTVQAWAQRHTTATRTAIIYSLEPVVAWLTSYALMGETLNARGAAGAVLILAGILVVELKPGVKPVHSG